ncbi:MAG: chromosomal replication initiator protein DnaA [Paracoccaceae bacterium]
MTTQVWAEVCSALKASNSKNSFDSWIAPLKLIEIEDGVATFEVPTTFVGNYTNQNFGDQILYQFNRIGHEVRRLAFAAAAATKPAARPTAAASASDPAPARKVTANNPMSGDFAGSPIDAELNFSNFIVGKPNELANAAARRVASGGPVTFNPLFLHGGVGLGKTHLMHAIANEIRDSQPGLNVLYLSAEQFMYRFITALRDRKMMDFKSLFRSVDVLMVDDVQFIGGKDSTQEEFFHTFNALVDARKQVIISGDRPPADMKNVEDRIRSRLQCGLVVDLHPTDYELRLGVLQSKFERAALLHPGIKLAPGVLELIAHRLTGSVRNLEGALNRIYAMWSLIGGEVSIEMAQDWLADTLKASERKVTIDEIQRKVSEHFNIRLSDMIGPRRLRQIARPRQIAMYLSKQITSRSLPEIGRRFGGRDHTTVIHAVKTIDGLMQKDSQIADDVELLRRALEA